MSITLRELPLPVKVVASVFLMAVGLGYTSAMVQLHMQDSKSGEAMPTEADVVLKFTGKKKRDPNAPPPRPVSRLEALVAADPPAITGSSMSAAFTTEDRAKGDLKFSTLTKGKSPEAVEAIKAHRKGEQTAFRLWINAPEADRKAAYEADKFVPPAGQMPKDLTPAFQDGDAVKIKSIIDNRCGTCHSKGGEKEDVPLATYEHLAPFLKVNAVAVTGDWVKVEEPISTSKLTQSTHAHLLSFAVLFSLTGLIFACSSYPSSVRCALGPWVVVAVFADVSLWWLARLSDEWGPLFARGVIVTGGLAGLGLALQITLSLFNMYGAKGKVVIALLFLLGGAVGGLVIQSQIKPALDAKALAKQPEVKAPEGKQPDAKEAKTDTGKDEPKGKKDEPKGKGVALHRPIHDFDRLLTLPVLDEKGNPLPPAQVQWGGGPDGSMVPAFFEKDKEFKKVMDAAATPQEAKDKLRTEREAELDALRAWARAADRAREAGYKGNGFGIPTALAGKVNPKFVTDDKLKVRSLIEARCVVCHGPEGKQSDYPLDNWEGVSKYLAPLPPPEAPSAVQPKAVDPIPSATDD
ncbi:hypothetical protein [Frigoriglobus tundricola]|uniref:Cytochrome c domain-containing protein n=1 Tax=Frigoriglobus tundricola TaxID=2774151 RepID=A0A6M5YR40_9BACT|nr:hypothetical protein [Frigoriglobus tundricola]QJW96537.1 hypothetical protein FTUN_4094 [Frigoriglobus tundricola]